MSETPNNSNLPASSQKYGFWKKVLIGSAILILFSVIAHVINLIFAFY